MRIAYCITWPTILCGLIGTWPLPLHAQVPALRRGSMEAARAIAADQRRMADEERAWRNSTKLTVMDKLPDEPRGQEQCLPPPDQLRDKTVGYLEYWQFEVMQVVSPNDVLLQMDNLSMPPIWLTGYSTSGLADGEKVRLVGLVEVNGTRAYETVAGARKTVRVVQFVKGEKLAAFEAAAKAEAEAERTAAEVAAKATAEAERIAAEDKLFRKWRSSSGKFSVEAKFVKFEKGRVYLEKRDGTSINVSPSDLSKADVDYYRGELRNRSTSVDSRGAAK